MRYDIAIIGTGPAGVSAAITAKVRKKNIILFGSADLSSKICKAPMIRNYPGLPDISGAGLVANFKEQLALLQIEVTQSRVSMVYAMGGYFGIQTSRGLEEASAVILAMGVSQTASLKREDEFVGCGVSYCATCDAFAYKDKTVAVVGYNSEAASEAEFLAQTSRTVYYFPMNDIAVSNFDGYNNINVVNDRPIGISGALKADRLECEASGYDVDGIFVFRDNVAPDRLVPGIAVSDGHILTDVQMRTNIEGCFACGDIAGRPYQYIKAAGQGNTAALSAVEYLRSI